MGSIINWQEIEEFYKQSSKILMENTEETRTGCKDGLDKSSNHLVQKRRTEIVRLRMATEFLLKALFINKGYCIFRMKDKFIKIGEIGNQSEIDLDRCHDFSFLISKLKWIIPNKDLLKELKDGLENIRKRGNEVVHGAEFDETVIDNLKIIFNKLENQF